MEFQTRIRWMGPVACAIIALALAPRPAVGQTILGQVLDQANDDPIAGVAVALVERDGEERLRVMTDTDGRFVLTPPEAGEYVLVADRFGYLETRSPLIALRVGGETTLELMLAPAPIGLEGLEVSVDEEVSDALSIMGISPAALGNRWINRDRIEAIAMKRDMGSILERTGQAGVTVLRPENLAPGSDNMGLCVTMPRTRTMGRGRCALVVLNGMRIGGVQALDIDPNSIESMALLGPIEASVQYGTDGGGGVLLVWTRRGR